MDAVERYEDYKKRQGMLGLDYLKFEVHGNEITLASINKSSIQDTLVIPDFVSNIEVGLFDEVCKPLKVIYRGNRLKYLCSLFRGYKGTELDLSEFNTSGVVSMASMFAGCEDLVSLNLKNFDFRDMCNAGAMFSCCTSLKSLDLSSFKCKPGNMLNTALMFYWCKELRSVNLCGLDVSDIENASYMFCNCKELRVIVIKHTRNIRVPFKRGIFEGCASLPVQYKQLFQIYDNREIIS